MPNCTMSAPTDHTLFPLAVIIRLLPGPWQKRRPCKRDEPTLAELLADPIFHQLMSSDGVGVEQFTALISEARAGLRRRDDLSRLG
jgi:hypothetical protein